MTTIVDSTNAISSRAEAPDKLRAELGKYYGWDGVNSNLEPPSTHKSNLLQSHTIVSLDSDSQLLFKSKKHRINIVGKERSFRDETQWNNYVSETITTNNPFLDHQTSTNLPTMTSEVMRSFHNPEYEDATKDLPSNQLLNYNLIEYARHYRDSEVFDIGLIRTKFDSENSTFGIRYSELLDTFRNRIKNFRGNIAQAAKKQENIYNLNNPSTINNLLIINPDTGRYDFELPYFNAIYSNSNSVIPNNISDIFPEIDQYNKKKNLIQSVRTNVNFSYVNFYMSDSFGASLKAVKTHDAKSLLLSTSISSFESLDDELFLLPEEEQQDSRNSNRFINQVFAARFLSKFRLTLFEKTRNIESIFDTEHSDYVIVGYKIEKYLNSFQGSPVQTYYVTNPNLIDTQLKYGIMYVYKVTALVGIMGSSYTYSNLITSTSEIGEVEEIPASLGDNSSKYWAQVDVEVVPSFQIIEINLTPNDGLQSAYVDYPTLPPHIQFYGIKNDPSVNFLLRPRFFSIGESEDPEMTGVGDLRPSDQNIANLYEHSGESRATHEYFTGIYEVYRTKNPPRSKEDFADNFRARVDETATYEYVTQNLPPEDIDITTASFSDKIMPNQKYYYVFRSLTYHGTPSQLTHPIEVELQRDSDEYKLNIKLYEYPSNDRDQFEKNMKRLLRLVPNPERLVFTEEDGINNWELGDGTLVSNYGTEHRTFKIRITSKHTGKKVDLNIAFKLNKGDGLN